MITALIAEAAVKQAVVSLAVVGAGTIRRLNREYLDHDRVTDVLAFDLSEGGGTGHRHRDRFSRGDFAGDGHGADQSTRTISTLVF